MLFGLLILSNLSKFWKYFSVMMLPNIQPQLVPDGVQPLLVFVNVKSGGCQGLELVSSFRKLLNPYQVFDLENGGPLPGWVMNIYIYYEWVLYLLIILLHVKFGIFILFWQSQTTSTDFLIALYILYDLAKGNIVG